MPTIIKNNMTFFITCKKHKRSVKRYEVMYSNWHVSYILVSRLWHPIIFINYKTVYNIYACTSKIK